VEITGRGQPMRLLIQKACLDVLWQIFTISNNLLEFIPKSDANYAKQSVQRGL